MNHAFLVCLAAIWLGCGGTADDPKPTCPAQRPEQGASCTAETTCDYPVSVDGCAQQQTQIATCADGSWSAPLPVSCGAVSGLTCDPFGIWTLSYAWDPPSSTPAIAPERLDISQHDDGIVYAVVPEGALTADGCQLTARWEDSHCYDVDGETWCDWSHLAITLDFSLSPANGTASYSCEGECSGSQTGIVTASK